MTDPTFYIETPNLFIHYCLPASDEHCDFLVKLFNTPEFITTQGKTKVVNIASARAQIETYIPTHARLGHGIYWITLKTSPALPFPAGTLVGQLSMMQGDPTKDKHWITVPDIGWVIHPDFTKKGYATEAAKGGLKYLKDVVGKEEIFAFTAEDNIASRRVCEKLGFDYRGVQPIVVFGGNKECVYATPGTKELADYTESKE